MNDSLFDRWAGSTTQDEMRKYTRPELLKLVTELYQDDESWQRDGTPDQVTGRLWAEINEER